MSYEIKWHSNIVHWIYRENVSGWDLLKSSLAVYADIKFEPMSHQIVDFSEARKLNFARLDTQNVSLIDRSAYKTNPNLTVLIIFPNQCKFDSHKWFVDEYGKETSWDIQVFDNRDAALKSVDFDSLAVKG